MKITGDTPVSELAHYSPIDKRLDDELMHWKYIKREKVNGKWRYFYTLDEYKAYKNSKTEADDEGTSFKSRASKFFKNVSNKFSKIFKKPKKEISNTLKKGKNFVDKVLFGKKKPSKPIVESIKQKFKYVERIKLPNGKYRYFYDNESYERYLKRMEYQKNEPKFMKKIPKISESKDFTKADDMTEVNEDYSQYKESRSSNCVYCTAAYELRNRGYDVQASEYTNDREYKGSDSDMKDFYKNPKMITIDGDGGEYDGLLKNTRFRKKFDYTSETINDSLVKYSGNDTRGEIRVRWKNGSGHSMVYEVDKKGSVSIRDCQTNQVYSAADIAPLVDKVTITRTDNLELKEGILKTVEDN